MDVRYPEVGICGLSCRLCPSYNTEAASRCRGCKSEARMAVGCPFITCAIKRRGIEFCGVCEESDTCEKWKRHREAGKHHDSFKCYQKLEADIRFIQTNGIERFEEQQKLREQLLTQMLREFNEGRSKSYYCIAATVAEIEELEEALEKARRESHDLDIKQKSRVMHQFLDAIARKRNYHLQLRR